MSNKEIEILKKALEREKRARKEAESILDEKGVEMFRLTQRLKVAEDILNTTIQNRMQLSEEESSEKNLFFMNMPLPVLIYEMGTFRIAEANQKATELYGYSLDEFREMTIFNLHVKEDLPEVRAHITQVLTNRANRSEWRHINKNGVLLTVKTNGAWLNSENKQSRMVIIEDLTEQSRLKKIAAYQEKLFKLQIENSKDIIYTVDESAKLRYLNPAGEELLGVNGEKFGQVNLLNYLSDIYRNRVRNIYTYQFNKEEPYTYIEFPINDKDGNEIWLGQNAILVNDPDSSEKIMTVYARDITDQKILERALLRSEEKYRSMIDNMNLGFVEVDNDGIIRKAGEAFCKIVGYTSSELEGTDGQFLLDDEGKKEMARQVESRKDGVASVYEVQLIRKDGEKRWLAISGAPFYDLNNRIIGTVGIHLDITEQKEKERELKESKIIAENLLVSKDLFFANLSHEIKTPLNAIIGFTELIIEQPEANNFNKLMRIKKASRNLLDLVNDILLMSKIHVGDLQLRIEKNNLRDELQSVFDMFSFATKEKGIDYSIDVKLDHEYYEFDSLRFTQIIQNLISNAIKFTNDGEVKLIVDSSKLDDKTDEIRIVISDQGIGIPEEEQKRIFSDFYQATNNSIRDNGGTGLGLAIVSKLVKMMNGCINLESSSGSTIFTITLPLNRSENPEILAAHKTAFNLRGLRILVVEDNKFNQALANEILESEGIIVTIAENGREALEFTCRDIYDLILMDLRMPIMDGIEATKLIKEDSLNIKTPIVAVSANSAEGFCTSCFEAGMIGSIAKPYVKQGLLAAIDKWKPKYIEVKQDDFQQSNKPAKTEFIDELKAIFMEDSHERIIQIKESIKNEDLERIKFICHAMKPSLMHMGYQDEYELAVKIEREVVDRKDVDLVKIFVDQMENIIYNQ